MGWSGGSKLAAQVWAAVKPHIHIGDDNRVANEIIEAFQNFDCDTLPEAEDLWAAAGRSDSDGSDFLGGANSNNASAESGAAENDGEAAHVAAPSPTASTGELVNEHVIRAVHDVYADFISTDWPSVQSMLRALAALIRHERAAREELRDTVHGIATYLEQGLCGTPQEAANELYVVCGIRAGDVPKVVQDRNAAFAKTNEVLDGVKDVRDRLKSQFLTRAKTLELIEKFCVGPPFETMWDDLATAIKVLRDLNSVRLLSDYLYDVREREGLDWAGPKVTLWSEACAQAALLLREYPG